MWRMSNMRFVEFESFCEASLMGHVVCCSEGGTRECLMKSTFAKLSEAGTRECLMLRTFEKLSEGGMECLMRRTFKKLRRGTRALMRGTYN